MNKEFEVIIYHLRWDDALPGGVGGRNFYKGEMKVKEKRWKPEKGEMYWYVWNDGNACWGDFTGTSDERRFKSGNCFKTEEEAKAAAEKVKALLLRLHSEPVTDCNQLPKLTEEVFDRPDCPVWAKYAAVDKYRNAMWYEGEPKVVGSVLWNSPRGQIKEIPGKFDASDWQNSLVERPARFPDWVEIGGYVYDDRNGYGKIVSGSVKSCYIEFDGGAGDFVPEAFAELKPARLRPFNAEEMKALVGKVIEKGPSMHIVTGFENVFGNECMVHVNGCLYSANDLLRQFTIDNAPCGVLEHLEEGEWVK